MARQIASRLRRNPRYLLRWAFDRVYDKYFEWKLGISTSQPYSLEQLGIDLPGGYQYQPICYSDFRQFMKQIPIHPGQDVFLDFGSGMGRALCLAAIYPFRKVIGVEISPDLNAIAETNIGRARHKLRCQNIQIVTSDAAAYAVPADVTIAYFFTPFSGAILAKVLENIALSLRENPRQMLILYYGSTIYPDLQSRLVNCPWLTRRSETILSTGRVGTIYKNNMWIGSG